MLDLKRWREWRGWIPAQCPGCGQRTPGQRLCAGCAASVMPDPHGPRCVVCAHPLVVAPIAGHHPLAAHPQVVTAYASRAQAPSAAAHSRNVRSTDAVACPDCTQRSPAFDHTVMVFDYAGVGRQLVHDFKVRRELPLAGLLADLLAGAVQRAQAAGLPRPDCLTAVPAHRESLRLRGFSPPAELARLLSRRLRVPYRLDLVRRSREEGRQVHLGRQARLRLAADTYVCMPGTQGQSAPLAGACVAVVDDVMTTGATLHAVAQALRVAGAAQVQGWVLARAASGVPGFGPASDAPNLKIDGS